MNLSVCKVEKTVLKGFPLIGVIDKVCRNCRPMKFEKVADNFCRGSNPAAEDFVMLSQKNIKKNVDLRTVFQREKNSLMK